MQSWPEKIQFTAPLREVSLLDAVALEQRAALAKSYERGVRDGERALSEQLIRQRSELLEVQNGIFNSLRRAVPQVIADSENTLISLAIEVAQKVLASAPVNVEMIEAAVREALSHVEETTDFTVLLHADDLDLLQKMNSPVLLQTAAGGHLVFQSSPEVTRGGCIVQTRFGVLDARRETKFALLQKSLQT